MRLEAFRLIIDTAVAYFEQLKRLAIKRDVTTLVVFVSCSKLAAFLHVVFILVEKHPVFFFAGLLFVFEILRMQKLVFRSRFCARILS